jgi:hypothetical protein
MVVAMARRPALARRAISTLIVAIWTLANSAAANPDALHIHRMLS